MGNLRLVRWSHGCGAIFVAVLALAAPLAHAAEPAPASIALPHYDLDITLDNVTRHATVRERVTWTNDTKTPTDQLTFNFYPHFQVPAGDALRAYMGAMREHGAQPLRDWDRPR